MSLFCIEFVWLLCLLCFGVLVWLRLVTFGICFGLILVYSLIVLLVFDVTFCLLLIDSWWLFIGCYCFWLAWVIYWLCVDCLLLVLFVVTAFLCVWFGCWLLTLVLLWLFVVFVCYCGSFGCCFAWLVVFTFGYILRLFLCGLMFTSVVNSVVRLVYLVVMSYNSCWSWYGCVCFVLLISLFVVFWYCCCCDYFAWVLFC